MRHVHRYESETMSCGILAGYKSKLHPIQSCLVSTPSRALRVLAEEAQQECFLIGCEHTQRGSCDWMRVSSVAPVLMWCLCTAAALSHLTPHWFAAHLRPSVIGLMWII